MVAVWPAAPVLPSGHPNFLPETIMGTWPDTRLLALFQIDVPIVLAPLAGVGGVELAVAVARAGGLGSLPCAMLNADQIREQVGQFRAAVRAPINLNFFCHVPPQPDPEREARWRAHLAPYYAEFGIDPAATAPFVNRAPFDAAACAVVESLRPEVVSFHFGLPEAGLLARVRAAGARILASATTVEEARWLEANGCDAVIAQGAEAGGHRGMFLATAVESQVGTFALVPQVADAVRVPVIATGGVADARGMAAAFTLGAAGVQIGTAYMLSPEAKTSAIHRAALKRAADGDTALTNLFTGRPARGIVNRLMREIGPMSSFAPAFPTAGGALAPLRAKTEPAGSGDFINLWSGQAPRLAMEDSAEAITRRIAAQALARLAPATRLA
ncbi:nitronate monooxygenase (plasmid) [Ralstonia pseudosolanacearum]|nr:2-nitropropane dioxygenase [Ralstonia solanacearum]BEU53656.1 nitronate monooxygenase [Ralstonia pseudosolanacearum]BCN02785.1 2-nitropropane dioxygenase [Ralstonia solanacearum]BEU58905.1 nitronate monooxygenase [Ralstonia pseudosolanacearum]BEU64058.1 nitronate monooxygenase [Ralstonia pseudosolanacearum]